MTRTTRLTTPSPAAVDAPADYAQPAGAQTPRRMRRAAEILAAAREVFLEKGFDRSSVSEIAAQVGVVEGLVYTYFPSKRELLNAVLRGMYEPLIADLEDRFSRLHGVRSRMRFLIWRHLRVYVEEPNLSRLVLHEVRTGPEYFQSVLHDLHVRYTAFLIRTVEEGIADGELHADTDVELLRSMVYGGIEHRMWGTLFGRGSVDVEAMADRYTAMVLGPLLPDGRAHSPVVASSARSHIGQVLDEVRVRLDQIEDALMASPDTPPPQPKAGTAPARTRRKSPP
ncbi:MULTISPECIES: TetR/AcrR family transcriptional regulator [Hydrogenophaga]|uniref:TetR/AcrR family transcriptional regulator n=2 Tax=Hydrogenophaga TaxID=47420 RepID=A0ABW2QR97_9BURK